MQGRLLEVLAKRAGGAALFPSLKALTWNVDPASDIPFATSVLSSVVEEIAFPFEIPNLERRVARAEARVNNFDHFLCSAQRLSPLIKHVHFLPSNSRRSCFYPPSLFPLSRLLQFNHLTALTGAIHLQLSALFTLAEDTSLLRLDISYSNGHCLEKISPRKPLDMTHLLELKLTAPPLTVTRFCTILRAPRLRKVDISINIHPVLSFTPLGHGVFSTDDQLQQIKVADLLRNVARAVSPSPGMRYVRICVHGNSDSPPVWLGLCLEPLHALQGLEELELILPGGQPSFYGANAPLAAAAAAWPSLRKFVLICEWHQDAPLPTPAVLAGFARSCPSLRELRLPCLDHRPPFPALSGIAHGLERLAIAWKSRAWGTAAPDGEEMDSRLAKYIQRLFPRLILEPPAEHSLGVCDDVSVAQLRAREAPERYPTGLLGHTTEPPDPWGDMTDRFQTRRR